MLLGRKSKSKLSDASLEDHNYSEVDQLDDENTKQIILNNYGVGPKQLCRIFKENEFDPFEEVSYIGVAPK